MYCFRSNWILCRIDTMGFFEKKNHGNPEKISESP